MHNISKIILIFILLSFISNCKKEEVFKIPELDCDNILTDINTVRSNIIGSWRTIEIGGSNPIVKRGYEQELIFLTDSTFQVKTNWDDTSEDSILEQNYELRVGDSLETEFRVSYLNLAPGFFLFQMCDNDLIVYNFDYWEKYIRN